MQPHEVRAVVEEVLAAQQAAAVENAGADALKVVSTILQSFGLDDEDRKEMRADFVHLRKWRKSVEGAQSLTFKVIVGTLVSGFLAACWMGIRIMVGK